MRLVIGARRSDLARLQAQQVAEALKKSLPNLEIEFRFKASLGDLDQDSPLVTMGNKGVFTQDFHKDLLNGDCDLVVHSWKDLPVEPAPGTEVVATLERADMRDVLLLRKEVGLPSQVRVLSSSPRRAYNLAAFLPTAWPVQNVKFEFTNVRGNIATRVQKLMRGDGEALVVAKAALDRLLATRADEYKESRDVLQAALSQCRFMILPLSTNPCAPAQGGLAIEINQKREDLHKIFKALNHQPSFNSVQLERKTLARYGGGCHQKIGVSVNAKPYGTVFSLRGLTDGGEVLNEFSLRDDVKIKSQAQSLEEIFPQDPAVGQWFERVPLLKEDWQPKIQQAEALWVARANALPAAYAPTDSQLVWSAGVSSWQALAKRGVWVNGCADGLGEQELTGVEYLLGHNVNWLRLTHQQAAQGDQSAVATYKIEPRRVSPDIQKCKYFFWMSGSAFERALELYPQVIAAGHHACGPGKTADVIRKVLKVEPTVFLSWQDWRHAVLPASPAHGR